MNFSEYTKGRSFFLIAGPCAIEGDSDAYSIASRLKDITTRLNIPFIFKASYRKANRSKLSSFTGIGDRKALGVLKRIKQELGVSITTDVHETSEVKKVAKVVDLLQIPAFLCRQTDLIIACSKFGKAVNIKKGQFISPESMCFAIEKAKKYNSRIMVTERGTSFGYQDLVVDFRGIPIMKQFGVPVVVDITHSTQKPNQSSGITGGDPQAISTLGKAAIAVGATGIFLETHPKPNQAKSDKDSMLTLSRVGPLLEGLVKIHKAIQE